MKPGDLVDVYFASADAEFRARVIYTPGSTGDVWVLERADGTKVIVQHYDKIVVHEGEKL